MKDFGLETIKIAQTFPVQGNAPALFYVVLMHKEGGFFSVGLGLEIQGEVSAMRRFPREFDPLGQALCPKMKDLFGNRYLSANKTWAKDESRQHGPS
jgi:hypothetical protein